VGEGASGWMDDTCFGSAGGSVFLSTTSQWDVAVLGHLRHRTKRARARARGEGEGEGEARQGSVEPRVQLRRWALGGPSRAAVGWREERGES
jgi:hypothetical protein